MVPATQGDLLVWIQADNRSALFDAGLRVHRILRRELALQLEVQAFVYHDLRDLSGFVDGIGNPEGEDVPNKKHYDPRVWLRKGEEAFVARLTQAFEDLNATGSQSK